MHHSFSLSTRDLLMSLNVSGVVLEVNTFLKGVGSQQKACMAVNLFTQTLYVYLCPVQLSLRFLVGNSI